MARFDRIIPPGGKGEVVLEVMTERLKGKIQKGARVFSNDPQKSNLSLQLKALVKKSIDISPKEYIRFTIEKGEIWSSEFKISSPKKNDFQILRVESPGKTINAAYNLLSKKDDPEGSNVYNLKLTVSPETPIGNVKEVVKVYTDIPGVSMAKIHLMGKVEGPIRYHPEGLTFVPVIKEAQISRTVDLFKTKGEGFHIKDVRSDHSDLEWKIIPVKDGRGYVLLAIWSGKKANKIIRGTLKVLTDDKGQPRIDIGYTVFPMTEKKRGI